MLIIKDKDGYIYGGYASQPWERHGGFYGDLKSFLFQLYPKASIFRPTGANTNIQWVSSHSILQLYCSRNRRLVSDKILESIWLMNVLGSYFPSV